MAFSRHIITEVKMVAHQSSLGPYRAKAYVGRIVPDGLLQELRSLFIDYSEIPLIVMSRLYFNKYKKILDAGALGFDNGLPGLFEHLNDVFKTQKCEGRVIISLVKPIDQQKKKINIVELDGVRQIIKRRREKDLFNFNNKLLWPNKHAWLLKVPHDNICIVPSPYEDVLQRNAKKMHAIQHIIRTFLRAHPHGVKLNQIDKRFLCSVSTNTFVELYPELFFLEVEGDKEPIIFDGRIRSFNLPSRSDLEAKQVPIEKIVRESIHSGLYQKTLLLIRKAGKDGLKLAVWRQSMTHSFKQVNEKFEIDNQLPNGCENQLEFFFCLAALGLVSLKSAKGAKNDIKIQFPSSYIDFEELFSQIDPKET